MASDAKMTTLTEGVIQQIKDLFPGFKTKTRALRLVGEPWAQDDLDPADIQAQLEAKHNDQTWGIPIKARVELVDLQTGKPIRKASTVTLAKIPKMTSRFSFIVDGGEYQVDHLLRLKSGVYTRIDKKGDLRSEFRLRKGGKKNFDLILDRRKNLINFKTSSGDAKIALYPLMKVMGVSDDAMEQAWGKQLFAANRIATPEAEEKVLRKFWDKTNPPDLGRAATVQDMKEHVYNYFDDTKLIPDTTQITLGKRYEKVTGDALLSAAQKLVKLERHEVEPDDRDSLVFKEVAHVEDFIPEKIGTAKRKIENKVNQTLHYKDNVSEILGGGSLFDRHIKDFFTQGGNVSERGEQTNPVQMLASNFKTTIVAKDYGGIKGAEKLGDEMRAINPSHFGFLDPMHTPESERTGITLHLGSGVFKEGKDIKTTVYDLKTGKSKDVAVPEFHTSTIVLPDQVKRVGGKYVPIADMVKVKLPGGDIGLRPFKSADFVMPSAKRMFSYVSNLIPFLPCDQGNRASMADKQIEQAISLKHRSAPYVQTQVRSGDPETTFESALGANFAAHKSPVEGKVVKITPDEIHIASGKETHRVQLYNNFPVNDPTAMLHSEPIVKEGDKVAKGQVVADSNYTRNGSLALGTNLRVGYIPYKGYNFEDGIVISEGAAKKLTSEHLHKLHLEIDPVEDRTNKKTWLAVSGRKATSLDKEQLALIGDDGVIKPGSVIKSGQVLIAALTPNVVKSQAMLERFGTRYAKAWKDKSLVWDNDHPGVVTRVVKSPNGKSVKVFVRTEEPAEIGDKLSGRHGNKGIITKILPDHEMPFTKHGDENKPLDILLNPSGVPTRINVGQVLETAAAKIAEKTGKPYVVNNFAGAGHDYRKQVEEDLKKHGLSDQEIVFDPSDIRKPLGSVLVGPQHILKLKHQVEKKLVVRGGGSDLQEHPYLYDPDNQPLKGGPSGGQGFGALEIYSLLGHNARHNLREMATYKGDLQDNDFWRMVREGHEPPPPKTPFSYQKFEALLKGLGVDVRKEGTSLRLMPMTDREIMKQAGNGKNEVSKPALLMAKTFKEEKGCFFDRQATGGIEGRQWSFLRLSDPLPNPLFVGDKQNKGPIPSLLSLKNGEVSVEDIDQIVQGKKQLNGKIGGKAISDALKEVDIDASIQKLRVELQNKRGTKKDQVNRTLKYLLALKDLNLRPEEAYVNHVIPVMPPVFRPIMPTSRGDVAKSSLNDLYRNLALANEQAGQMLHDAKFDQETHRELRANLWNSYKALQSVGRYDPAYDKDSYERRELKGIIDTIGGGTGEQPKEGYFQEHLIKRKQDLSIRSTIVPEPSLHIDQVGLPQAAAMELYKPFVVARMTNHYAYKPDQALKEMQNFSDHAKRALDEVMADRPLLLKRDPALHKFSVMAFRPTVVEGKAIKIHPLVCGGFNADFDGDTMAGTVPVSQEAVAEARKMFPSANLFSPTNYGPMHVPSQEFLLGLNLISGWGKKSGKKYKTIAELQKAHERGDVGMTDVVRMEDDHDDTTLGRLLIAKQLPSGFDGHQAILHDPTYVMNSGALRKIVGGLAKNHSDRFDESLNRLKDLGTEQSFKHGFSIGLKDFAPIPERAGILAAAHKQAAKVHTSTLPQAEKDDKLIEIYGKATEEIDAAARDRLPKEGNRLAAMVYSGARGKSEQLRQMIAAPMLVQDSSGRTVPMPVTRSYGEGLDLGDYWLSQHGARKGTLQRASGTREPGSMTKDIINSTISTLITSHDCGTQHGISMSLDDKDPYHEDIHGRFLARDYGAFKAGTVVDPAVVAKLRTALGRTASIQVRSPLKCQHGDGICAKCFGLNETGNLHPVGTNIGILAGQALGEPATQLAMDAFHTGGVAGGRGGSSVGKIERLKQLLKMPKTLRGSAVLAKATGPIQNIKPNPALGGHIVTVGGLDHLVRADELKKTLNVGDVVEKGQSLSHERAPIHPKELLAITKDLPKVQNYLVDELYQKLYKKENVRPRNIELVVRALTNYTRIKDPAHSEWETGDIVPHSVVEEYNRGLKGKGATPVAHEPVLHGSGTIPRLSTDWMARLNYQRLGETIQRGAGMAWKSDIHGAHPIPGLAYGTEFGAPPKDISKKRPHVY